MPQRKSWFTKPGVRWCIGMCMVRYHVGMGQQQQQQQQQRHQLPLFSSRVAAASILQPACSQTYTGHLQRKRLMRFSCVVESAKCSTWLNSLNHFMTSIFKVVSRRNWGCSSRCIRAYSYLLPPGPTPTPAAPPTPPTQQQPIMRILQLCLQARLYQLMEYLQLAHMLQLGLHLLQP